MSDTLIITEIDALTGDITERPLTAQEIAERNEAAAKAEVERLRLEEVKAARESALAKLEALGLTPEEVKALVNG